MSLHTAQHLLSAVLDTKSLPTLSWSMTAHPSLETPYVELPRALTWAEAKEVEDTCNRLIAEAKRVWIDVSIQIDGGETGDGDRESRGIPKDYAGVSRFGVYSSTWVPRLTGTTSSEQQAVTLAGVALVQLQ
jgi:Ser-tRNA(Ala) deacylase AlaX